MCCNLNLILSFVLFFSACTGEEDKDKSSRDSQGSDTAQSDTATEDSGRETDTNDSDTDDTGSTELEAGTFVFQDEEDILTGLVGVLLPAFGFNYVLDQAVDSAYECPAVDDLEADPTVITGGCEDTERQTYGIVSTGSLTITPGADLSEWPAFMGDYQLTWDAFSLESKEASQPGILSLDATQDLTAAETGEVLYTSGTLEAYGELPDYYSDGVWRTDQMLSLTTLTSFSYTDYEITNFEPVFRNYTSYWGSADTSTFSGTFTVEGRGTINVHGSLTVPEDLEEFDCEAALDGSLQVYGTTWVIFTWERTGTCDCIQYVAEDGTSGEVCGLDY